VSDADGNGSSSRVSIDSSHALRAPPARRQPGKYGRHGKCITDVKRTALQ